MKNEKLKKAHDLIDDLAKADLSILQVMDSAGTMHHGKFNFFRVRNIRTAEQVFERLCKLAGKAYVDKLGGKVQGKRVVAIRAYKFAGKEPAVLAVCSRKGGGYGVFPHDERDFALWRDEIEDRESRAKRDEMKHADLVKLRAKARETLVQGGWLEDDIAKVLCDA